VRIEMLPFLFWVFLLTNFPCRFLPFHCHGTPYWCVIAVTTLLLPLEFFFLNFKLND
jgi:hypothetical protein